MIWDDHEIRDNWSAIEGAGADLFDRQILDIGKAVSREYQRQLWGSVLGDDSSASEFHYHRFGILGVVFLDQRGGRESTASSGTPYLGRQQWARLTAALGPGGLLTDVVHLVVAGAIPLAFLPEGFTRAAAVLLSDMRDQWSHVPFRPERIRLLELCRQWQSAQPGREVTFVAGDAHIGMTTEILFRGEALFRQLVSSPVASVVLPGLVEQALRKLCAGTISMGGGYELRHLEWEGRANFGVLDISRNRGASGTALRLCAEDRALPVLEEAISPPAPPGREGKPGRAGN